MAEIPSLEHGLQETIGQVWDGFSDLEEYDNQKLDELGPKVDEAVQQFLGDFDEETKTFSRETTDKPDYFALKAIKLENKLRQTRFRIEMHQEELDPKKVEAAFTKLDEVIERIDQRGDVLTENASDEVLELRDDLDTVYMFIQKKEQYEAQKKEGQKLVEQFVAQMAEWKWTEEEKAKFTQYLPILGGSQTKKIDALEKLWQEAETNKDSISLEELLELTSIESEISSEVLGLKGLLEFTDSGIAKKIIERMLETKEKEEEIPYPLGSDYWDKPEFFDETYAAKVARGETRETIPGGIEVIRDAGLTFYVAQKGETLEDIRKKLAAIPEFSYLKEEQYHHKGARNLSGFNITEGQFKTLNDQYGGTPDRRSRCYLPIPVAKENRVLSGETIVDIADKALTDLLAHPTMGPELRKVLKKTTRKELIASIYAFVVKESSPDSATEAGVYTYHRWEPPNKWRANGYYSFSMMHVFMQKGSPGFNARIKLGLSEGQTFHPANAIKLLVAFFIEKAKEAGKGIDDYFPITQDNFETVSRFYNGTGYKKNNYHNVLKEHYERGLQLAEKQASLPEDLKKKLKTETQRNLEQELPNKRVLRYVKAVIKRLEASKATGLLQEVHFTGKTIENPQVLKEKLEPEIATLLKNKKKPADYSVLINGAKNSNNGQKAYIIDETGLPIFEFSVSTGKRGMGKGNDKTPLGSFCIEQTGTVHQDGQTRATRTRINRKFGQYFELQADRGMVPSLTTGGGKARMVSAILALQKLDGGDPGFIYLHGTNRESALENRASGGCVRFDNISILVLEEIFKDQQERLNISIIEKPIS